MLIEDGCVLEAGPTRRVENLAAARDAREINAAGRVVMSGFVDCLTRFACAPLKSAHLLRTSRIEARGRSLAALLLRHGVTAMDATAGHGLDDSTELKTLRAIRALEGGPWDLAPCFRTEDPRLLERLKRRRYARRVATASRAVAAEARRLGCLVRSHGDATLAIEYGAAACADWEYLNEGHCSALAQSAAVAVARPDSPVRFLIDSGGAVALATGYTPDEPSALSLQAAVGLACRYGGWSPEEAITAATINAAWALGLGRKTGSLEVGKQADLLLLNCSDYREIPYHFGVNQVFLVMKKGMVVYREGSAGTWPKA